MLNFCFLSYDKSWNCSLTLSFIFVLTNRKVKIRKCPQLDSSYIQSEYKHLMSHDQALESRNNETNRMEVKEKRDLKRNFPRQIYYFYSCFHSNIGWSGTFTFVVAQLRSLYFLCYSPLWKLHLCFVGPDWSAMSFIYLFIYFILF